MGILTVEQIVSVDGYAAAPDGGTEFFEAADFGDERRTDSEQMRWLETVDAVLLGAETYRKFAAFWPTADPAIHAVAGPIAALPKYVVSNTLESAPWGDGKIEILRGDGAAAARDLTARHASTVVWGSLRLATALLAAGEVDVLRLRIVPVLLGAGRSFTPDTGDTHPLRLAAVHPDPAGVVTLTYERA